MTRKLRTEHADKAFRSRKRLLLGAVEVLRSFQGLTTPFFLLILPEINLSQKFDPEPTLQFFYPIPW
jgi:hypothetical protein